MKTRLVISILLLVPYWSLSQNENTIIDKSKNKKDTNYVSIITDVDFASSTGSFSSNGGSSVGTLGVQYKRKNFYGGVNFTVFSQNTSTSSNDSIGINPFGNNLLIPQNSTERLSSFSGYLGSKNLNFFDSEIISPFWEFFRKNTGFQFSYSQNNTVWENDTAIALSIGSLALDLRTTFLNETILESKEEIKIILSLGLINRSIGGDYALPVNEPYRADFLGTNSLGFNGFKVGVRLELSKFYGAFDLTGFSFGENIPGFSGQQSVVRVGLLADISIPTESNSENYKQIQKSKPPKAERKLIRIERKKKRKEAKKVRRNQTKTRKEAKKEARKNKD